MFAVKHGGLVVSIYARGVIDYGIAPTLGKLSTFFYFILYNSNNGLAWG